METQDTIRELEALKAENLSLQARLEQSWADNGRLLYEIKCLRGMLRDRVPEVVE